MYFEDFKPGSRFESEPREVRAEDVQSYADLSGDLNPLHFDDEYAIRAGFRGRVSHGMLILCLGVGLWYSMDLTRDSTIALLGFGNIVFESAVYPGDRIRLLSEVVSCRLSGSRPGAGIVTFKDVVLNQQDDAVVEFERKLMLKTAASK